MKVFSKAGLSLAMSLFWLGACGGGGNSSHSNTGGSSTKQPLPAGIWALEVEGGSPSVMTVTADHKISYVDFENGGVEVQVPDAESITATPGFIRWETDSTNQTLTLVGEQEENGKKTEVRVTSKQITPSRKAELQAEARRRKDDFDKMMKTLAASGDWSFGERKVTHSDLNGRIVKSETETSLAPFTKIRFSDTPKKSYPAFGHLYELRLGDQQKVGHMVAFPWRGYAYLSPMENVNSMEDIEQLESRSTLWGEMKLENGQLSIAGENADYQDYVSMEKIGTMKILTQFRSR